MDVSDGGSDEASVVRFGPSGYYMGCVLYGSMHLLANCAPDSYTVYQINKNFLCCNMLSH